MSQQHVSFSIYAKTGEAMGGFALYRSGSARRLIEALLRLLLANGFVALAAVFSASAAAAASQREPQTSDVLSVDLSSSWSGLPGESQTYSATITRRGDTFQSSSVETVDMLGQVQRYSRGSIVPTEQISNLIRVAFSSPVPSPVPAAFGFTKSWLAAHAGSAFQSFVRTIDSESVGFYTEEERKLYLRSFQNPRILSTALEAYYTAGHWTDDEVDVTAVIHLRSGPPLSVETRSQRTMMLPWTVTRGTQSYTTFDPAISLAVQQMLPKSVVRYRRLSVEQLTTELPGIVGQQISQKWSALPPYNLAPKIDALERRYQVNITHASTSEAKPSWSAELRWTDLPANESAIVHLPIVNNNFGNTDAISNARAFAEAVYAIPWVQQLLKDRADVSLQVLMEHSESAYLNTEQQRDLLADLKALGRDTTAARIGTKLSRSFVVMFDQPKTFSDWVVMPDGEMILWHYYDAMPPLPILDLSLSQMAGKKCRSEALMCSGVVRSPNGAIEQ